MIVNEKIDKLLWLILVSDLENRDMIIDFISNMSDNLKIRMVKGLDMFEEYKKTGIKNFTFLCGVDYIDNILYNFDIDIDNDEINIELMVSDGNIYREVFRISLYLGNDLENRKVYKKNYIGRIEYNIDTRVSDGVKKIVNYSKCEYNLTRTMLGDIVTVGYDDTGIRSNYIDMSLYKELFLDDINSIDLDKSLVRKRKK